MTLNFLLHKLTNILTSLQTQEDTWDQDENATPVNIPKNPNFDEKPNQRDTGKKYIIVLEHINNISHSRNIQKTHIMYIILSDPNTRILLLDYVSAGKPDFQKSIRHIIDGHGYLSKQDERIRQAKLGRGLPNSMFRQIIKKNDLIQMIAEVFNNPTFAIENNNYTEGMAGDIGFAIMKR